MGGRGAKTMKPKTATRVTRIFEIYRAWPITERGETYRIYIDKLSGEVKFELEFTN